jgi:hypothetical protein
LEYKQRAVWKIVIANFMAEIWQFFARQRESERESECGCVFQRAPNECEISRHHSTPPNTHPTTLDVPLSINMKYYHLITTN